MATKFFKCRHCGNVIHKVVDSKVMVVCCGEVMEELIPNAGLAVIANAGHFCFLEQRVIFDRIMKSYFKIGE